MSLISWWNRHLNLSFQKRKIQAKSNAWIHEDSNGLRVPLGIGIHEEPTRRSSAIKARMWGPQKNYWFPWDLQKWEARINRFYDLWPDFNNFLLSNPIELVLWQFVVRRRSYHWFKDGMRREKMGSFSQLLGLEGLGKESGSLIVWGLDWARRQPKCRPGQVGDLGSRVRWEESQSRDYS